MNRKKLVRGCVAMSVGAAVTVGAAPVAFGAPQDDLASVAGTGGGAAAARATSKPPPIEISRVRVSRAGDRISGLVDWDERLVAKPGRNDRFHIDVLATRMGKSRKVVDKSMSIVPGIKHRVAFKLSAKNTRWLKRAKTMTFSMSQQYRPSGKGKYKALSVISRQFTLGSTTKRVAGRAMDPFDIMDWDSTFYIETVDYQTVCKKQNWFGGVAVVVEQGCKMPGFSAPNADMRFAKLRGADLSNSDLSGANLLRSDLTGANLSRALLKNGTNLESSEMAGAKLGGAQFGPDWGPNWTRKAPSIIAGANLSGAFLYNADMSSVLAQSANMTDAYMGDALLNSANMRNSKLDRAYMVGVTGLNVNLDGASLQGVKLSGCVTFLGNSTMSYTDLTGADLSCGQFSGSNFEGANLNRANLNGSQFYDVQAKGADLTDASLQEANLIRSNLDRVNFTRTNLRGARFFVTFGGSYSDFASTNGATWAQTTCPNGVVTPSAPC